MKFPFPAVQHTTYKSKQQQRKINNKDTTYNQYTIQYKQQTTVSYAALHTRTYTHEDKKYTVEFMFNIPNVVDEKRVKCIAGNIVANLKRKSSNTFHCKRLLCPHIL